jgi:hypothetical protein
MKLYPHPRPLPVLRRARGFLVSSGQHASDASLSSLHIRPRQAIIILHLALKPSDPTQLSLFLIPPHPRRPMQNT